MRFAYGKSANANFANGKKAGGFTLIELMIVVAVIAILSSLGIPAYNDYVTRGKLVDATSKLADMRIQMEQYYQDNRDYGSTATSCALAMPASKYFAISCNWGAGGTNQSYQISATGTINKTNFTYTINQSNTMTSTTGWGNGASCWVTRRGGC